MTDPWTAEELVMARIRRAIDALLKRDYTLEEIAEDLEGWV